MNEYEVKYFRLRFNNNKSYYICNFTKDDTNWYHGTAHSLQGNKRYLVTRYVEKEPLPGCTITELLTHSDDRIKFISQDRIGTTNYDVEIRSDPEGGNITLRSQNKSQVWEIDSFDNNALRILNLVKGGYLLIKNDGSLENVTITDLYNKYNSFNSTKGAITGSALGNALGMTSDYNWASVVSKITGVSSFNNAIQTATTDTSNLQQSCYRINGGYIEVVPAIGYWGTWNYGVSCIKIPVSTAASTQIGFSGRNIVTHNDDGTSTGSYETPNYVNMSLFNTITIGVNLHGEKDAYGSGGKGTVTCEIKNASGTVLAQGSRTGSGIGNSAFNGNFTIDVSSVGGSAKVYCTLYASGAHAWKPNNNGKARYTGHAEITSIVLS